MATTVGVFKTRAQAQQAVRELQSQGYTNDQIGLVAKDEPTDKSGLPGDPTGTRWEEGTGIGAAAGAATGTGLGLAVAAGLLSPVGPLIAGGALIALIASAGAGATVGTIVGGLVGLGVPEDDAAYYDSEVAAGRYVVTVESGAKHADVQSTFRRYEGYDRHSATDVTAAESILAAPAPVRPGRLRFRVSLTTSPGTCGKMPSAARRRTGHPPECPPCPPSNSSSSSA